MQMAALLKPDEVKRIHEASLEILENVGIFVRNRKAREIFASHGCDIDRETSIVKIPPAVVEEHRELFVPYFAFRGRDPAFDRIVPNDRPVIVTGSSAPDIIDPVRGRVRRATSKDIANIAFLINELPGFDVFSISTLADDAPPGQFSLTRFYPALKNCLKPVRSNTSGMKDLMNVIELGSIIAGGEHTYMERPIITLHYCPVISPLTMDDESTEAVIFLTERKLPVYGSIVPNAGISAPMTIAGTLVVGNAEFLALAVLQQMINPSTPVIYSVLSTVADMRTADYAPGAVETGILQMAHSQMAHFYGVPSGGYIGLTNSHVNDAQSGYETGINTTAALLAGTDMLNMGGLLSALMVFDFAKAVIDSEIAMMLKRIHRGVEFSEEDLALELIAQIGPGGNFMESRHTIEHMRSVPFLPTVSTRKVRNIWEREGCLDVFDCAIREVERILTKKKPPVFSKDVDDRIRSRFKGIVAGDTGWYQES